MRNILILVICTLLSVGVLCAVTSPVPANLMAQPAIASEGALSLSSCTAGEFCSGGHALLAPGDGGPAPYCAPGKPCNNDQLRLQAGDGGPAPYCAPGKPCNNDQEKLLMAL